MTNSLLLFEGIDANGFFGLWETDGTLEGTHELAGIPGGLNNPQEIITLNGKALIQGYNSTGRSGLWVTDGTVQGTHELTGIAGAFLGGVDPNLLTIFDDEVLFTGRDASGSRGLWITDGTVEGTHELNFNGSSSIGDGLEFFNGVALFSKGEGLWVTDLTTEAHELTGIAGAYAFGLIPQYLAAFKGPAVDAVLFNGINAAGHYGLWITDATSAGTRELIGIPGANSGGVFGNFDPGFTTFNGKSLFRGVDASGQQGLWVTDGTAAGTYELNVSGAYAGGLFAGLPDNVPPGFTVLNGKAVFQGHDASGNFGLWTTDGTGEGTHEITGIIGAYSGGLFGGPFAPPVPDFTIFDNEISFTGTDTSGNFGLWITNGTAEGTYELAGFAGAFIGVRLTQVSSLTALGVSAGNHPPVASNIAANANEDTNDPIVKLVASFIDADLSDTFTFTTDVTGTLGLVTNNHDGTFTYDPNRKFESLSVGDTATDTFKYTVDDARGGTSTATATVTIHGENDPPSALPDAMVVQKGAVVTANAAHGVLINDSDPDKHDTLHVSKVNGLSTNVGHAIIGAYGMLTLNADGSYSYSANKSIPGLTNKGGVQDQFAYSIDDGHGGTASSTLTVTVQTQQALNKSPVLSIHPLDANKDEGNSGTTPFTFVVTRDANTAATTSVDWKVGPANGVTADGQDFTGGLFPTGTVTFGVGELSKVITVNVQGDTLYESNGRTENFVVTLLNPGSGATLSAAHDSAVGHIHSDDLPLQTAKTIFANAGTDGEIVILAALAQAAYHLVPGHELTGAGINLLNPDAEVSYNFLPAGLQILTTADLSLPAPVFNDPEFNFPTNGLIDGVYLHGNAAALVARSSDSIFIAFRGTNDVDHSVSDSEVLKGFLFGLGTPDLKDWGHMDRYYDLLSPLIQSLNEYIGNSGVKHVYVTGHSLGAAMAQRFVTEHPDDERFQAVTFANPGYNSLLGHGSHVDDPRILNIHVNGDPIQSAYPYDQLSGDDYVIYGAQHIEAGGPHDMALYYTAAQFLNNNYALPLQTLPHQSIASNGIANTVNLFADIASHPSVAPPGLPTWQVTLPSGTVIPILGTSGIDYIKSAAGNDEMIGGPGNDTFVFNSGRDTVIDFRSGQDVIQLDHSLFKNFAAVVANAQNDGTGDTVITDPTTHYDAITLLGVTPNQLHTYDFHIV